MEGRMMKTPILSCTFGVIANQLWKQVAVLGLALHFLKTDVPQVLNINNLRYHEIWWSIAVRTADLFNAIEALYQLS